MEEEHANYAMTGFVKTEEVDEGIDGCGKRTVEPTTTLANELRSGF